MRNRMGYIKSVLLILILSALLLVYASGVVRAGKKEPVAVVSSVSGKVWMIRGEERTAAEKNLELGDLLETEKDSSATLTLSPGCSIVMNENSRFGSEEEDGVQKYVLKEGQIRCLFNGERKIGVSAGDALITAGTAEIDLLVRENADSQAFVIEGKVWWRHEKWSMRKILKTGECIVWNEEGIPTAGAIDSSSVKAQTEWYEKKER